MATRSSLLLLCCLAVAAGAGVLQEARAQPDSNGFISIDCGLSGKAGYVDNATKLTYLPDAGFTDAGTNHNISAEYISPGSSRFLDNVRSFPGPALRSCYTLRSLVPGLKYLVRACFRYGNYDGLRRAPLFDLYAGVNFWTTVNITDPATARAIEAIVVVPEDSMQVCLVNTGAGTPYISSLELRPLKNSLYPHVNATQGLAMAARINFGPADTFIRYPDDPHDRTWAPYIDPMIYEEITTTKTVQSVENNLFEVPSAVMQTAIAPLNVSSTIYLPWDAAPSTNDPSPAFITVMHFSELQLLQGNATRNFNISINNKVLGNITPDYLYADSSFNTNPYGGSSKYNITLRASTNSTMPPIINALEIFSIMPTVNIPTYSNDVSAITTIKKQYQVKENWMGDPCVPKTMAWDWLTCSYAISNPPTIIGVNLSFNGLNGYISTSFTNLSALQYLNLSYNNLTGSIPESLSQLSSLTVIDLSGNHLTGSIPSELLKRAQDKSLDLRYDNNPNLCINDTCTTTNGTKNLAIYISVPLVAVMVILLVLLYCFIRRRKIGPANKTIIPHEEPTRDSQQGDSYGDVTVQLENRRFTYKDLQMITNNFQQLLGKGGFGYVYYGILEEGTQVAVKLRLQSSNQGVKEFLVEAQILTRIHHKNLVSLIGYCKDGEYMALVYEYMSEGTLQEHITGRDHNRRNLSWRERLQIGFESAQGLEYLHRGCNPPLIHRDVKATNILLDVKLQAKISDFGLSKAFNRDSDTHLSTSILVGTPGYIDPEYHATMMPTSKSDVYGFGVVLLELITGKPPILRVPEPISLIHWVQQCLSHGNIEGVVDAHMYGSYDINSVWKVADIALKCTAQASTQRPTMTEVVSQLEECLDLELHHVGSGTELPIGHVRKSSTIFEMGHLERMPMPSMSSGPSAR
ncbi:putative leucine-rich repeat receptor-like serine/threonine-protein kinase At2g19230 [Oryza brachyantha]|uniref:putative leucine-rich repeat receptor-like serine/threonine-protein kinase At2g19230 n=1 Tax=Oryza brachyantha TaxID=4533 RepID=UPI0007768ED9|nr:putative leucine-rich repeat receptor-like serine/threonine-protein kinase At2g19230 [Oryza brachyantha]